MIAVSLSVHCTVQFIAAEFDNFWSSGNLVLYVYAARRVLKT